MSSLCKNDAMGDRDQPLWRQAATHTLHTALILKAELEERLHDELGLLLADNEALLNLSHGPLRMTHISKKLILSRGGTTKVIDRLEELGYVRRSPDPDDRRATIVGITDDGRRVLAAAREVIDAGLASAWAHHLTNEEAEVVVAVMDRVVAAHHEGR